MFELPQDGRTPEVHGSEMRHAVPEIREDYYTIDVIYAVISQHNTVLLKIGTLTGLNTIHEEHRKLRG
jgi:hypothetical protein